MHLILYVTICTEPSFVMFTSFIFLNDLYILLGMLSTTVGKMTLINIIQNCWLKKLMYRKKLDL